MGVLRLQDGKKHNGEVGVTFAGGSIDDVKSATVQSEGGLLVEERSGNLLYFPDGYRVRVVVHSKPKRRAA